MPSKGTARRSIRLEDDLWLAACTKAAAEGTDVSAVIRKALTRYVAAAPRKRREKAAVGCVRGCESTPGHHGACVKATA